MLRNILGPVFNASLDQFFNASFFLCFLLLAETPMFIVLSAKHAKFKENTKKEKKTLFVNTIVLIALVKMSVFFFFSAFFIFAFFWNFHLFSEMFFDWFPKIKNNSIPKQETENKNNNKKTRCKTKTNQIL